MTTNNDGPGTVLTTPSVSYEKLVTFVNVAKYVVLGVNPGLDGPH